MQQDLQALAVETPPLAPVSYGECVERLARAVDQHNDDELEEVARLISQLAVVIEM
ncbi:hypothetical protein JQ557_28765 [Bradyrhizobium sp. U87765 SZCCT0131]|uniref:hypothetical protein n=1 Tax=unclassified Bradyrhizobium TaxID=2631580 RepID=UPI001BAB64AF|nr:MULTISPECIES: hypothetical protein [unclassified Bradyrhizobium]MBR1222025.1 hypothetical protein [Bradyrhizobium sp. U87765 SZCCT0131]MBR1263777.1 hypothetical protein [Bradyrhizobium sp. U87765 SZCCT0134]MBR1302653.1 hypothetical protein [Bradyrhizobium sp. U87765 SZCCT0110]MBR1320027.1 hypothetical protein [Bradyrhizobium sp. U87765 SZCCT0109]MBR1348860.1 hypothetical protein [Bradyrhizobium sp. U87765 SZCCT0048]